MTYRPRTVLTVSVLVFVLLGTLTWVAMPAADTGSTTEPGSDGVGYGNAPGSSITGENVSVAILDPTGFDTDDPAYASQIASARTFGPSVPMGPDAGDRHGTRAATELANIAPDASLYLAGFEGEDGYGRAMAWAVRQDVDVVVVPATFQGKLGTGNTTVENVTERAVAQGVTVIAAAGNTARGHWTGTYDTVQDGALVVEGSARNYLRGDARTVSAWLAWDRAHDDEDYTLELYRVTDDDLRLVARSVPYRADDVPNERLNVRVDAGTHLLVVRGPDRPTGATIQVTTETHRLQHVTVQGSIVAPATAHGVITVGAFDPATETVPQYSASGPTPDGRQGVDLVADARGANGFNGTSAAATRVGGVAALIQQLRPGASPATIERLLERSTNDVGEPGPDPRSGAGRLQADRAVDLALAQAANESIAASGTLTAPLARSPGTQERVPVEHARLNADAERPRHETITDTPHSAIEPPGFDLPANDTGMDPFGIVFGTFGLSFSSFGLVFGSIGVALGHRTPSRDSS